MDRGNSVQKALSWVAERLKQNPSANKAKLRDEASQKFDLNPRESDMLFEITSSE